MMVKFSLRKKAVLYASLLFISYLVFLIIFQKSERILTTGSDLFQTAVSILSGFWLYKKYLTGGSRDRSVWLFLSLTMYCYAIGMFIWDYYEIYLRIKAPFPGVSDLFWLLMYVFILIGYMYIMHINRKMIRFGQIIYDTLILVVAATTISWDLVLQQLLHSLVNHGIVPKIVSIIYPLGNLAILFALISLFQSVNIKFFSKALIIIFLGTLSFLTADTMFLYLSAKGKFTSGHLVDLLWVAGILMIGISPFFAEGEIFLAEEIAHPIKMDTKKYKKYLFSYRLWLPYLVVILLYLIMMIANKGMDIVHIGAMVSILLIIFRQISTLVENEILLERYIDLNKELELKVQQRTQQLYQKNEQLSKSIQKVEHMAFHDPLTELPNRRYFEKYLHKALSNAKESNENVAVLFLDLDRYKLINDTLGHSVGDFLLQQVAKRLSKCVGDRGMISRHGGDEFLIMLQNADQETASVSAENILNSLREVFKVGEYELFITSSIGISLYPDHGTTAEVLTKRADVALFAAKKAFRNQFIFYQTSMNVGTIADLALEKDLRIAVEKEEFKVVYQPLVQIQTGEIRGVEALARWTHPHKGMISPETFIPIAEESGMIIPLGLWVLKTACTQWKQWNTKGISPITMAVNISIKQFFHPNFLEQIQDVLTESEMDPTYLELEITENTFVSSDASKLFEALKQIGIKISIDDFGTGYSSLQYLKRLPINKLKIDQSFIMDIPKDGNDVAIVQTIIAMAHHMNLEVVAEGIETVEQLSFLQNLQCHFAQGYLFSKPLAAEDFENKFPFSGEL